ncbi:ferrochelatase [Marinobacterium sp. D7]|uniref:ferrochelatase n=1 Tax=Marinobacterium ramblicola TaxID=2849041 RepID=UPI001C2D78E6|nr:ferrochelatase [Marinobacterium ramblicola]MBV1787933.1 ferrochelatase [Marinobacterium ramblicola]
MKYRSVQGADKRYSHQREDCVGVLLTNLGTPDEPTPKALRRYLKEFLWDPRVVELPRPLWWLILNGIILNTRPRRSAEAYRQVWTDAGSPLLLHTRAQADALSNRFSGEKGLSVIVDFAMRYGNPSIESVIQRMQERGVRRLLVLPLYPQYSAATTASTFDALAADFTRRRWLPDLRFVSHYHDFPAYIEAMALSIEQYWQHHGRPERLLLSYHGVPERYLHSGDPYYCECRTTSRLLARRLGVDEEFCMTTFQSRFGREEWLKPYTDETLKALPGEGVKSVQVYCPGFSADCLETIEEIGVENRDYFLSAGGERYGYIPALNDRVEHIDALELLIRSHIADWLSVQAGDSALRQERAQSAGAIS